MSGTVHGDGSCTYEVSPAESVSEAVATAVSTASGHDRIPVRSGEASDATLDPLYSAVDPEALDALFRRSGSAGASTHHRIEFSYEGYRVAVHSDGLVAVRPETGRDAPAAEEAETAETAGGTSD